MTQVHHCDGPDPDSGAAGTAALHVLLMRTDRLGDMILTLPMASALKAWRPDCRVSVLASRANALAAQHHPHVDHVHIDSQESKGSNLRGVWQLARRLQALRPDVAVLAHPTLRLAVAAYLARIPVRVGTAYRFYSLLLNRRVDQHRRGSDKHECQLNLDLLQPLGIAATVPARGLWRSRTEDSLVVEEILRSYELPRKAFVVLHPGSSGSAMNWATHQYISLGRTLGQDGTRIVITGGMTEASLTKAIAEQVGATAVDLGGRLGLGELAELFRHAAVYVGGSTGPTQLAAIVDTPVVALFPPISSTLPRRWRPLGNHVTVILPNVGQVCPVRVHERCPYYHCMETRLDVATVAEAVRAILARAPIERPSAE